MFPRLTIVEANVCSVVIWLRTGKGVPGSVDQSFTYPQGRNLLLRPLIYRWGLPRDSYPYDLLTLLWNKRLQHLAFSYAPMEERSFPNPNLSTGSENDWIGYHILLSFISKPWAPSC